MTDLTQPQARALRWLYNRAGSGLFGKNNAVLLAQGERCAAERKTWNALRDAGRITIEKYRVTITDAGTDYCRARPGVPEAATVEEDE